MKYDVEYETTVYITARGVEAESRDEAIRLADARWDGKYPVVATPSESASWLTPDDVRISKYWDVSHVTGDDE